VEVTGGGSPALRALRERWAGAIRDTSEFRGEETAIVDPGSIIPICRFLRDDAALQFAMLADLCAIHYLDRDYTYEVVYLLYSFKLNRRLRLKVRLAEDGAAASVTQVWPAADWLEREAYDLVGVRFEGHPDLRRILMPEDYDRHPLRRDFHLYG
jgi:NADH-quinone oxidoreductase subunit C